MKIRKIFLGILFILTLTTLIGCSSKKTDKDTPTTSTGEADTNDTLNSNPHSTTKTPSQKEKDQGNVMEDFNTLINSSDINLKEVISFIDNNISSASPEDASTMLMKLEELQINYLLTLEDEFANENIQLLFLAVDLETIDYNNPENLQADLVKIVQKTKDYGYKIEQAEGFYFPVIDYSIYEKYTSNVNPDIKAYFTIMESESTQVYVKDASLLIDWPVVKSKETAKTDTNPYYVAGIDNAKEFEDTFYLLQEFVANGEKEKLAEYISYPINVSIEGKKTTIKTEAEFIKNYDKVLTDAVKNAFLNQKLENVFVNYAGVMIGNGEIWISQITGTKHLYSIYAINND